MPKAVLINASPHPRGNTAAMLAEIEEILVDAGVNIEKFHIGGKPISGCTDCRKCQENKDRRCVAGDILAEPIIRSLDADVLVVGSPTYFSDLTPEAKAFIDRCGRVARANDFALKRKIGAAVTPGRRAGSIHALDSIHHMFLINQMIIPGSIYWAMSVAPFPGDYENDDEGVNTMKVLAGNIVWLLEKTA